MLDAIVIGQSERSSEHLLKRSGLPFHINSDNLPGLWIKHDISYAQLALTWNPYQDFQISRVSWHGLENFCKILLALPQPLPSDWLWNLFAKNPSTVLKNTSTYFWLLTWKFILVSANKSLSRCLSDLPLVQSAFIWEANPTPGKPNNCREQETPFYVNEVARYGNNVIVEVFVPSHFQYLTNVDCVIIFSNQSEDANECQRISRNLFFLYHSSAQNYVVFEWDFISATNKKLGDLQFAIICGARSERSNTFLVETKPVLIGLEGFPDEQNFECWSLANTHKIFLETSVSQHSRSFSLCGRDGFQETEPSIGQRNHCQFSLLSVDGEKFVQFIITEVVLIENSPGSFVEIYASNRLQHKIGFRFLYILVY